MFRKLTIALIINLLLVTFLASTLFAQIPTETPYIFRIEVSECKNEPAIRRQTGFLIRDENVTGIVTALHGVADCPQIRAIGTESEFADLQIVEVDIGRDLALLWSERAEAAASGGLRIETDLEATEGDSIYTIGYPVNLVEQLPTRQMTLRGTTQLINLVPDNLVKPLYDRKSPDLGIQVLSIEGHLLPGHSGAPIFNQDNRLIGVGNGGLDSGRVGISWAIPWREIDWEPVSDQISDDISPEIVEALNSLRESNVLFFSFVSSDPSREELIEKTVCKSVINANYEGINQLKDDLLLTAKQQIVGELFGEFLMTYNQSGGSSLSNDQFTTLTAGYVRTTGDPIYKNHETRLGEVCVSVEGFVTPEDKRKLEPVEIASDEMCVTENLPNLELKRVAEDQAIMRALVNYDGRLEGQNKDDLLRLMKNVDFSGSAYDDKTGAYCATVKGKILPIEIIALLYASDPNSSLQVTSAPSITESVITSTLETTVSSEDVVENEIILDVGETWDEDGLELTLEGYRLGVDKFLLNWKVENNTDKELYLKYFNENFSAINNLGQSLKQPYFRGCVTLERIFKPGDIARSGQSNGCPLTVEVDMSNKKINEIIVTASDISRIEKAQWRIPVDVQ